MGVPVYVSVTATTWDEVELKVQGMAKAVGKANGEIRSFPACV